MLPLGGAMSIGRFLAVCGPHGLDVTVAGLCDAGEEHYFRSVLERTGPRPHLTHADMEQLGFYVCVADLEDELIRGLGADTVQEVLDIEGDLRSFRTFQKQPRSGNGAWSGSCAGSWGRTADARRSTRAHSWNGSTSTGCHALWTGSSRMSDSGIPHIRLRPPHI